jgi:hypothetical protein
VTNAERQARWRTRRAGELDELRREVAKLRQQVAAGSGKPAKPEPAGRESVAMLHAMLNNAKAVIDEQYAELKKLRAERKEWRDWQPDWAVRPRSKVDRLKQLIQLCHPDRHDSSALATEVSQWLIKLRAVGNG